MQIFPPSQNITISKFNKVSYFEKEKQNFLSAAVKKQFQDCLKKKKQHFLNVFQSYYDRFQVN